MGIHRSQQSTPRREDQTDVLLVRVEVSGLKRAVGRELLLLYFIAILAAVLLYLAGFVGIAFMTQTYLWSLGFLYSIRLVVFGIRSLRGNAHHEQSHYRSS